MSSFRYFHVMQINEGPFLQSQQVFDNALGSSASNSSIITALVTFLGGLTIVVCICWFGTSSSMARALHRRRWEQAKLGEKLYDPRESNHWVKKSLLALHQVMETDHGVNILMGKIEFDEVYGDDTSVDE